jgi:hypothetical protein
MNFKQAYVRKPVLKWPGNKTGRAYHTTGTIPVALESARTSERIEQETGVLRDLYAFLKASSERLP